MATLRPNLKITSGYANQEGGWGAATNTSLENTDAVAPLSVKAYGATGDGATDDLSAINSAIASLGTGGGGARELYFPVGTYMVTNTITVTASDITITLAPGAVLKAKTGFPASTPMLTLGNGSTVYSNLTVRGGKFDGNALGALAIHSTGPNKNVRVLGVEVTGTVGAGTITFEGVTAGNPAIGVIVSGCYVHDVLEGMLAFKATDVQFIDNRVEDMNVGSPQDCIEVSQVTRFIIANNLCRNCGASNSCIDVFENSSDGIIINNILTRSSSGSNTSGISFDHATTPVKRIFVNSNIIAGGFGSGISTSPGATEIVIFGNTIRDLNVADASKGIGCQSSETTIIGNKIMRTESYSIHVIGAVDGVRILDNDLIDPIRGSGGGQSHIDVNNASATNIVIKGNRFSATSSLAQHVFNIGQSGSAGAQILIEGNEFRGTLDAGGRPIQNQNDSGITARRNTGFITENNGTATIASGTTSIAVNHGLSKTPALEDISVVGTNSPTNDPGHVWLSTVGATQFTINCRTDPGSGGATFAWAVAIV